MRVLQTLMAFGGNAQPQLAVTRRLVERGHEVRVLAHRAARQRIEATGAEFVEFGQSVPDMDLTTREPDTLRDWEARTRFGAGMRVLRNGLLPVVLDTSRECASLLEGWPADVLVLDWMLSGAAAEAGWTQPHVVDLSITRKVQVAPLHHAHGSRTGSRARRWRCRVERHPVATLNHVLKPPPARCFPTSFPASIG